MHALRAPAAGGVGSAGRALPLCRLSWHGIARGRPSMAATLSMGKNPLNKTSLLFLKESR